MRPWIYFNPVLIFGLSFAIGASAYGQVAPTAEGGPTPEDDNPMITPPSVGGMPFASGANVDTRSNYVDTSLTVTPSYIDNVLPSASAKPVSDAAFSILPSLSLVRSTSRQLEQVQYSPAFSFYQHTNTLDTIDQAANLEFQYRFTPHVSATVQDTFLRTSNVFDSSYLFSSPVTGSTLTPIPTVIVPFAEQLLNTTSGVLSYQFGKNGMVGGGGEFTVFNFSDATQNAGIYNSKESEGAAFYNHRLSNSQYIGAQYQYSRTLAYLANGVDETQVHSVLPFYSLYFHRNLSLTASIGAQFVAISPLQLQRFDSWSPEANLSFGWEGEHGGVAVSYAHMITSGGGLLGSYTLNGVSLSGGWKLARSWNGGVSLSYVKTDNMAPLIQSSGSVGNTLSGQAALGHSIGEHFAIGFGYQYFHEQYDNIPIINADPNANREFISLSCHLQKALGR